MIESLDAGIASGRVGEGPRFQGHIPARRSHAPSERSAHERVRVCAHARARAPSGGAQCPCAPPGRCLLGAPARDCPPPIAGCMREGALVSLEPPPRLARPPSSPEIPPMRAMTDRGGSIGRSRGPCVQRRTLRREGLGEAGPRRVRAQPQRAVPRRLGAPCLDGSADFFESARLVGASTSPIKLRFWPALVFQHAQVGQRRETMLASTGAPARRCRREDSVGAVAEASPRAPRKKPRGIGPWAKLEM